jgi:hypothetical protein
MSNTPFPNYWRQRPFGWGQGALGLVRTFPTAVILSYYGHINHIDHYG